MRAQVVLLQGDRILLARHERANGGYWVLPGGAVEESETPEAAAVREVYEETGLRVALERLLFVDGPRRSGEVEIRQPRYTYLGRVVGGELRRVVDREGGCEEKGYLSGVDWMPFDDPLYDARTRDTLQLVMKSLE